MIDYSELEKKFKKFRRQLLEYKNLCEYLNKNQYNERIIEKEEKMRSKLTQVYGALAGYIHGMAGYVEKVYAGVPTDIFMLALYPIKVLTGDKRCGIEVSLQCLDKAIGGCQYAKSVEFRRDQIIIHKGAVLEGFMIINRIFKEAKKKIFIRDRYIAEDIFLIIERLNPNINIKMLIQEETYGEKKDLELLYIKYQQTKKNVEIRELTKKEFHSREILIDDQIGYELTFSIKDVGRTKGLITRLKGANLSQAIIEFESNFKSASKL